LRRRSAGAGAGGAAVGRSLTSVVDIGGPFWNFEMRDAAAREPAAPASPSQDRLISMVDRVKLDLGDPRS